MKDTVATGQVPLPDHKRGRARRVICGFGSIRFAVLLMALIAMACFVGTLIAQEPCELDAAIARYGLPLGPLVWLLGLNHLYSAWWFLGLVGLLTMSVGLCAFSGARFSLRKICTLLAHASVLLIVAGAILRGVAGVDGMLAIEKGQTADAFEVEGAAAPVPLGFQLRLDDFVIRYYDDARDYLEVQLDGTGPVRSIPREIGKRVQLQPDGTAVEVLRYLPDFRLDGAGAHSASDEPLNPAVEVRFTGPAGESRRWLFAKFPEFDGPGPPPEGVEIQYVSVPPTVKAFESHVTCFDERGKELRRAVILVNAPLKVGRYTLYQAKYNTETLAGSTLEVTRDPGGPFTLAGFVLLPIGIALAIYVRPLLDRKGRGDV